MNYRCTIVVRVCHSIIFSRQVDTTLHKQYTLEKFKEGHTGRNFVVEEPKFEFSKPVFKKSFDLPKASSNSVASDYLTKRKLDPDKFYFAGQVYGVDK